MPPNGAEVARPASPLRSILPQSPLRIKQDGKFYERLLTKESSGAANPSFRYWAEPGSVPFVWESQPGTPKVDLSRMAGGALPAITPPPSYLLRHGGGTAAAISARHSKGSAKIKSASKKRCRFKRIKIGFIAGIFRRLAIGKAWRRPAASSAQVSSSTSSRWLFSSAVAAADRRGEHHQVHGHHRRHGQAAAAQKGTVLCSDSESEARQSPWTLRFRVSVSRSRDDGWA